MVCFDKTGTVTNGRFELLSLTVTKAGVEGISAGDFSGGAGTDADHQMNVEKEANAKEKLHRAIAAVE